MHKKVKCADMTTDDKWICKPNYYMHAVTHADSQHHNQNTYIDMQAHLHIDLGDSQLEYVY